jgi:putative oxidoreductase
MADRASAQSFAYAALRVVSGAMFAFHGAQKVLGVLTTKAQPEMWSQAWIGGIIELVGGILIAIGLFTRPAALLASGTMAVAYFQFHWFRPFDTAFSDWRFLPIVNGGELAALYCFVFLLFAVSGAGPSSLDSQRGRG